jgi:hypothetical protein
MPCNNINGSYKAIAYDIPLHLVLLYIEECCSSLIQMTLPLVIYTTMRIHLDLSLDPLNQTTICPATAIFFHSISTVILRP